MGEFLGCQLDSPATVQLMHDGRVIDEAKTLCDAGLRDSSTVDAVLCRPRLVLTFSEDYTVRIWNADTGACAQMLPMLANRKAPVRHASFSPDGRSVVIVTKDGAISVWKANTCKHMFNLSGQFSRL